MASTTKRQRELARAKYARQQARRAAQSARRRRRQQVLAAIVAIGVVAGGMLYLDRSLGGDDSAPQAAACTYTESSGPGDKNVGLPPGEPDTGPAVATIETNRGTLTLDLLADKAPCTVGSMEFLASKDFFDKTRCHRMTGSATLSVLQCGDPSGNGSGGPGYRFAEENLEGATYPRGTIAMAKTQAPGTTGSQFFLVYQDSQLPPEYTPFGTITTGLDVLDAIAKAGIERGEDGAPKQAVIIEKLTVQRTA